jgi:hypothetical protein
VKRLLLACGIVAPVVFVLIFSVDGVTRPNYNAVHQWVSQLSLGPRGWLGTLNLGVTGLLMLGFGLGLRRVLTTGRGSTWGPRFASIVGCGLLVAALFQQDPGLGYPPGVPASTGSRHDILHKIGAFLLFGSLTGGAFTLRHRFGRPWPAYSVATGIGVILTFIATSVLVALDYAGVYPGAPSGLLERTSLVIGFVWVFVLAVRLFRSLNPYVARIKAAPANARRSITPASSRERIEYTNRRLAQEHISPMFSLTTDVNVPADKATQAMFDLRGDAASNQSAYLMGQPHQALTINADGDYLTFGYGGDHASSFDGWIDHPGNRLVLQGHWWYRGEFVVEPQGSGGRITYNVYNIAPAGSRWMVPLMQLRFRATMRASLRVLVGFIQN